MQSSQLPEPIDFEWDKGNQTKSLDKHVITTQEAEGAFFNFNRILPDTVHSTTESRFVMYGKTNLGLILFISFTIRRKRIRVISARRANPKERKFYEEASQEVA